MSVYRAIGPLVSVVLDGILFILTGNDAYMRAWMSSRLRQIRPLVSKATDSVIMAKTVSPLSLGCFSSDPFHTSR